MISRRYAFSFMKALTEPADVLYRIKRGLAAYVSYLAACEMNQAFSEYVLYEPILRILTARNYPVECECECPGIQHSALGDRKRIDFVASRHSLRFAIEIKWARSQRLNIQRDVQKLEAFRSAHPDSSAFLCVFGRQAHIEKVQLLHGTFRERGKAVYADLRKTKYGCRIYELDLG